MWDNVSHFHKSHFIDCRKSLEPPSQIATVVLLFVKYFPVTTIATTYITNMWHFGKVALDGHWGNPKLFRQFFCGNIKIIFNTIVR